MSRASVHTDRQLRSLFTFGTKTGVTDSQLLAAFVSNDQEAAEQAFEVIVERHGPMVLRVCRDVLRDLHSAEDAFQATFLVLARKARHLQARELLANWLYGVALRTARRAKVLTARRRARESKVATRHKAKSSCLQSEQACHDLERVLHEEIERLPRSYRAAVIVCYLEGMSQTQAAQKLQLSASTIRGRLAQARKLLERRLVRRGISPNASLLALKVFTPNGGSLPVSLVRSTAQSVFYYLRRTPEVTDAIPALARDITTGVLITMRFNLITAIAMATAVLGLFSAGVALVAQQPAMANAPTSKLHAESLTLVTSTQANEPSSPQEATEREQKDRNQVIVNPDLIKCVSKPIVRTVPITKDCMVLSYLPDWNFGNVDNIGVGNNDGGVRTLIEWPLISAAEAAAPDRQFVLAVFSRKTISHPPASEILAFENLDKWPERVSWRTKPRHSSKPAAKFAFEPGEGWKLFDVTSVVRAQASASGKNHGIVLRFLNEDVSGGGPELFSDYKFVSREGTGEWADKRPVLLVVESSKKAEN
jgi:RNA polymerase sigma factor (sigma-70 family)